MEYSKKFDPTISPASSYIVQVILFSLLYWIISWVGVTLAAWQGSLLGPFWPSSGLAVYLLLSRGLHFWPAIPIGYSLVSIWNNLTFLEILILAPAATLEATLAYALLTRVFRINKELEDIKDIALFILLAGLLSPLAATAFVLAIGTVTDSIHVENIAASALVYLLSHALGILIISPPLLQARKLAKLVNRSRIPELSALIALTLLCSYLIFRQPLALGYLTVLLLFWAAIRFEAVGVFGVSFIVLLVSGFFTGHSMGPFLSDGVLVSTLHLQIYIGTSVSAGLLLISFAQLEARRRSLIEARRERRRFQIAAENSSDLIYQWTLGTDTCLWFGNIDEALHYPPDGFPRTFTAWKNILHPEDKERVIRHLFSSVESGSQFKEEYRIVKRNGEVAYWDDSGREISGDDESTPRLWIGAITDVTERIKFQEEIRKSEELFQAATRAAGFGALEWDAVTGRSKWTDSLEKLFGSDHKLRAPEEFLNLIHPEDRPRISNQLKSLVRNQETTFSYEYRVVHPDETVHWLMSKGRYFFNQDGKLIRVLGVTSDITDIKEYQFKLSRARLRAEAGSRAKMQFLANMSHEIRTPMNAILGFTDLLMDSDADVQKKRDFAERIKVNGQQLLNLIDDILDLSKYESGEIAIEREAFSVLDLVDQAVKALKPLADRKGLDLKASLETPIPEVIESDPFRVRQILNNLIGNSLKFTNKGYIEVRLHYGPSDSMNRAPLTIHVEDSGIGISEDSRKNLFKAFSQGDSSITRKYGGTGLGLVLSRNIAQALGGNLRLAWSRPGQGSCFTVEIDPGDVARKAPLIHGFDRRGTALATFGESTLEAGSKTLPRLNVLLADDSPDNEELIKHYLTQEGAKTSIAHNGAEAVEMAQHDDYDVILMDIQMPVMDGLEATRKLRAGHFKKPVIALTAHAFQSEIRQSLQAGCDAHLTKPVQRKLLIDTIRNLTAHGNYANHMME